MKKGKKIVFKSINIMLAITIMSIGIIALNNKKIVKLESQEEKTEKSIENYLKVGDYVDYDPTKANADKTQNVESSKLVYESPIGKYDSSLEMISHGNGNTIQKFTAKANDGTDDGIRWRVLSVSNSKVELISEYPIKTDTNTEFTFKGGIGYLYAEQELNEICKIYGYGYGANTSLRTSYSIGGLDETLRYYIESSGASNINVNDINKIANITTTEDFKKLNSRYGSSSYPTTATPTTSLYSSNTSEPGRWGSMTKIKHTAYSYDKSYITDTTTQELLFGSNENRFRYWLASRAYTTVQLGADGCVGCVNGAGVAFPSLYNGNANPPATLKAYSVSSNIRPKVTIDPNVINISQNGENSGTKENPWSLIEISESHTVTFKDGDNEETQTINHGESATPPLWTKDGYTLTWNEDYTNITEDKTITAKWTPNTDTAYKVEYYKQKVDKSGYELAETVPLTGTTEETVNATIKSYPGFTENTTYTDRKVTGEILGDGSLVLKVFYDRNSYKLTINIDGETEEIDYVYGEEITLPTDKTKEGYTFEGWYNNEELTGDKVTTIDTSTIDPEGTQPTYYIKWTTNEGIAYRVEYYQQKVDKSGYELAETVPLTGTTEETVNATIKSYPGFTENTTYTDRKVTGEILGDGSLVLKVFYDRNTYKLTINIDGETEEIEYTYGEEITLPTDKTKEGYTFEGWYDNEDLTGEKVTTIDTSTIDPEGTQPTYYIKWTGNEGVAYRVEYYQEKLDGTGYELFETVPLTGIAGETVNAEIKTYTGFTQNTTHENRKVSGEILGDGSLVLKVFYNRIRYTLTIEIEDDTRTIEYIYGEEIELPTDFKKEGYTFEGWYDNEDFEGEPLGKIDTTTIDENTVFYPKWTRNTFTVTFKDEEKEETRTVNQGETVTAPNWTKPGYTLTWNKDLNNITENTTITAIWVEREDTPYKVEYYLRSTDSEVETYTLAETIPLTGTTGETVNAEIKEYPGFEENTTYAERKVSGTIAGDGSLTLKVYYTRNTYRVTLNTNRGIITSGNINNYTYGIEMVLPTRITREGFTFRGWYDNAECTGEAVTKITSTDIGAKTYHAKWEGNPNIPYTVEYYGQKLESEEYELLETVPLTGTAGTLATAPVKEITGFTENAEYVDRVPSGEIEGDGSLVLKLYYTRNTYKITLNLEDETREIEYTYGETVTLPTDIVKEGYVFVGWYDNEELTGNPITQITPEDAEDKTFYIKWATEDEYYITSEVYSLDFENNYITKVSPNTTITTFMNNITTNGTKKVVNARGEDVNTETLVGTGYKLQVTYKGVVHEYEIAVRGDVDGNGEITVTDLSMVNQSIVQSLTLTGVKKIAADTDYNGEITVTDLSMVNQAITGKTKL